MPHLPAPTSRPVCQETQHEDEGWREYFLRVGDLLLQVYPHRDCYEAGTEPVKESGPQDSGDMPTIKV